MLQIVPGSNNDPLFQIFSAGRWVPLTDSIARKHLKKVSNFLNVQPTFTFHDFRRAGTSWGFTHGVPLKHLMQHGTWKSNAVWKYISADAAAPSVMSKHFSFSSALVLISPLLPCSFLWCLGLYLRLHFDLTGHFHTLQYYMLLKSFKIPLLHFGP